MPHTNESTAFPPSQFGALQAAAWAECAVRFWRHCLHRGTADARRGFDIVDLSPRPNAMRLVRRAIARQAGELLGVAPRLRHLPCGGPSAEAVAQQLRARLAGAAAANPVVVLANGAWQAFPQRLLAVHYGSLLEGDLARLTEKSGDDPSGQWRPLSIDGQWGACLTAALSRYRAGMNSAPLVLAEGAKLVIDAVADCAREGYLLLSEDLGHATEKQVRLCRFEELLAWYRKGGMPVDFQLLAAQLRDSGALTWQRPLGRQRAVVAAAGGLREPAAALDAATVPLREGSYADGELLARSARIVASHGHADAVLALVRQSRHEPAVFLAACPGLHKRLAGETERLPWAEALAAVWEQRVLMRANPAFHRELARAAVQVAQWGLARKALRWGMRVHGESTQDLVLLTWCEANTGGIERARLLAGKAQARGGPQ